MSFLYIGFVLLLLGVVLLPVILDSAMSEENTTFCNFGIHSYVENYRVRTEEEMKGWGGIWGPLEYLGTQTCRRCGKTQDVNHDHWEDGYSL